MHLALRRLIAAALLLAVTPAHALLQHGNPSQPPPANDVTATALAGLQNCTDTSVVCWSSDLVPTGFHVTDVGTFPTLMPGDPGPLPTETDGLPGIFAFSSGDFITGQKAFINAGGGGHSDWSGDANFRLDFTTGKWSQAEPPSRWVSTGVADSGSPCTYGETSYKPYPNVNGHRGKGASHTYSTNLYFPALNQVVAQGAGTTPTAQGVQCRIMVDGTTGLNVQATLTGASITGLTGSLVLIPSGFTQTAAAGKAFVIGGTAALSVGNWDPNTGVSTTTHRGDINNVYSDVGLQGPGVIIPDPNNAGDCAYVFWTYNFFANGEKVAYFPKVCSGTTGQASSAISFGGTVPAALSVSNSAFTYHNAVWFDWAGNYKAGSTKILVWDWGKPIANGGNSLMTGLYLLDTATWTFTGPFLVGSTGLPYTLASPTGSGDSGGAGFRLIMVGKDWVSAGNYLPIILINPRNGQYYVARLPWSFL